MRGRTIIAIFFILIILFVGYYAYRNKDTYFKSVAKIYYTDGCIEKYENAVLVTPECTYGRALDNKSRESKYELYTYGWNATK